MTQPNPSPVTLGENKDLAPPGIGDQASVDPWQPIESAPMDGTPILAWCVHPHARWATDNKDWSAAVVTQWIDHNGGGWTWNGMAGTFTHWMPLPTPPSNPGRIYTLQTGRWGGPASAKGRSCRL